MQPHLIVLHFEEYDNLQQSPNKAVALPIIKIMTGSDIDII
jgi:hypothetical protein